jgi:hypothetical protein
MPISAGLPILQAQLKSIASMGVAATPQLIATMLSSALAAIAPMGLLAAGPAMIPLVPAGITGTQSMLNSAYNTGTGGKSTVTSQMIAAAVSILCPMVPPTGITLLQTLLSNVDSLGVAGTPDLTAQLQASAIITYFTTGLVI